MASKYEFSFPATVVRVVDGDTVRLSADVGFHMRFEDNFRLADIDAPEVRGRERPEGLEAKVFLQERLPVGAVVLIHTRKAGKYGRWIATIHTMLDPKGPDGPTFSKTTINDLMVRGGHAVYRNY